MGTRFTVTQPLYPELLSRGGAASLLLLPATRTERVIAHLKHRTREGRETIAEEVSVVISGAGVVVLACTCFPLVGDLLRELNPRVTLLDPALGVDRVSVVGEGAGPNRLTVALTGNALTPEDVRAQAPVLFPGWELESVHRV